MAAHQKTLKRARISGALAGDNDLIAAVPGRTLNVVGFYVVGAAAVTLEFWDGPSASGTSLSGIMSLGANADYGQFSDPHVPLFKTTPGNKLVFKLGGALQLSGYVVYFED